MPVLRAFAGAGGPLLTFGVVVAAIGLSYARRRDERKRREERAAALRDSSAFTGGAAAAVAQAAAAAAAADAPPSKYFAALSAEALKMLVATAPVPRVLLDVRADAPPHGAGEPLPPELAAASVAIAESKVASALTQPAAWAAAVAAKQSASGGGQRPADADSAPLHTAAAAALADAAAASAAAGSSPPPPARATLLVFLDAKDEGRARRAARVAGALGFERTAVVAGGVAGYKRSAAGGGGGAGGGDGAEVAMIGRDALAALLGRVTLPPPPPIVPQPQPQQQQLPRSGNALDGDAAAAAGDAAAALLMAAPGAAAAAGLAAAWRVARAGVLDVRRHDERALYGAIPGALHVPADELPSALALPAAEFARRYRAERPPARLPLVLLSRTTARAFWAAQAARDAGFAAPLVLRGGAYGWRADGVRAYPAYALDDAPPEPEPSPPEPFDAAAALEGLLALGLARVAAAAAGGPGSQGGGVVTRLTFE